MLSVAIPAACCSIMLMLQTGSSWKNVTVVAACQANKKRPKGSVRAKV